MREQALQYLSSPKEKKAVADICLAELGKLSIAEIEKLAKDF